MDQVIGHSFRDTKRDKSLNYANCKAQAKFLRRKIEENFAAHQPTELLFEEASNS